MNKQSLRQFFRQKRVGLTDEEQEKASISIKQLFCEQPEFIHSQYIAGYWPILGEINPVLILDEAIKQKKKCFLPIMPPPNIKQPDRSEEAIPNLLSFVEYTTQDTLMINSYGILEPPYQKNKVIPVKDLEIVLTPLLGFDPEGTRLGMGKGFYDRTFAFLNEHKKIKKPRLVGLAYGWQAVSVLPKEQHDVVLFSVVTDKGLIYF